MDYSGLPGRVAHVQETIAAHQRLGGWSHPVAIVAVTKTRGPETVRAAAAAGLRVLGENRVQEALSKMALTADLPVEWHLIGTLQRNKVRQIVGRFRMLHAVDRPELIAELARRIPEQAPQSLLLEVNCGGEAQKAGVAPEAVPRLVEETMRHPSLRLEGLMTMAPFSDDPAVQRAAFRRLRETRDALTRRGVALPELSMGMSNDFTVAVEEGATMVRLGTILFGERTP